MKKLKIWIVFGIVVIGLGVISIQAELVPARLVPVKAEAVNDDLLAAKESQGEGKLSNEQPGETIGSDQEFVSSVLWCRDEFGRLFNIVESHPPNVIEDLNPGTGIGGYWYRDRSGRLYKSSVEVEQDQPSGPGIIWYRDETGRLFMMKLSEREY